MLVGGIFAIVLIAILFGVFTTLYTDSTGKGIFSGLVVAVILGLILVWVLNNTAMGQREIKSLNSNVSGGLERTVEVYDYNGDLIKIYEGKIDIQEGNPNKVLFDVNGKRRIIHGGIVIIEEE